jgi:hypothetical protein
MDLDCWTVGFLDCLLDCLLNVLNLLELIQFISSRVAVGISVGRLGNHLQGIANPGSDLGFDQRRQVACSGTEILRGGSGNWPPERIPDLGSR